MGNRTVDIIIPCYNTASFLPQTIDSALAQTYRPVKVLVIDDGSTDHTYDVVQSYEGNVDYFYQENQGQAAARNTGIGRSDGEYICLLDADDIIYPEMIQKLVNHLERHLEMDYCHCATLEFGANDPEHPRAGEWRPIVKWADYVEPLSVLCAIHLSSTVFRRATFEKYGLLPEGRYIQGCEDWFFWLKSAVQGARIGYVPEVLTLYRMHPTNSSSDLVHIATRESRLIVEAVKMFGRYGVDDSRRKTVLSYGVLSKGIRWLELNYRTKFDELVDLSLDLLPDREHSPLLSRLLFQNGRPYPNLLYLALSKRFADLGLVNLAAVMFLNTSSPRLLRRRAISSNTYDVLDSVLDTMAELTAAHPSESAGYHGETECGPTSFRRQSAPNQVSWLGHIERRIAKIRSLEGDRTTAGVRLERAIALDPYCFESYKDLAILELKGRKPARSVTALRKGFDVDREQGLLWIVSSVQDVGMSCLIGFGPLIRLLRKSPSYRKLVRVVKGMISRAASTRSNK
jgi:glycosyltransferase involved in cell wall biosynthesis